MLKKNQRLNLSESFKSVVKESKRIETAHFKLFIQKTDKQSLTLRDKNKYPKVGIALTKKEFRKAHERNRARRLTAQVIGQNYVRLIPNMNLVIIPKASVNQTEVKELLNEIDSIAYLYSTH